MSVCAALRLSTIMAEHSPPFYFPAIRVANCDAGERNVSGRGGCGEDVGRSRCSLEGVERGGVVYSYLKLKNSMFLFGHSVLQFYTPQLIQPSVHQPNPSRLTRSLCVSIKSPLILRNYGVHRPIECKFPSGKLIWEPSFNSFYCRSFSSLPSLNVEIRPAHNVPGVILT